MGQRQGYRPSNRWGHIRRAWKTACKRVGLEGALFHDLRRTGVRNLIRAGVPERVAMEISGHRTRSVFDRYNIVSEEDLREAARKLDAQERPVRNMIAEDGDNSILRNIEEAAIADFNGG